MLIASFPPVAPRAFESEKKVFIWIDLISRVWMMSMCVFVSWFHLNLSVRACALFHSILLFCSCSLIVCFLNDWIDFVCFPSSFWVFFCPFVIIIVVLCVRIFLCTLFAHAPANAIIFVANFNTYSIQGYLCYGNWHHNPSEQKQQKNDNRDWKRDTKNLRSFPNSDGRWKQFQTLHHPIKR